jgi:hypothetical protein
LLFWIPFDICCEYIGWIDGTVGIWPGIDPCIGPGSGAANDAWGWNCIVECGGILELRFISDCNCDKGTFEFIGIVEGGDIWEGDRDRGYYVNLLCFKIEGGLGLAACCVIHPPINDIVIIN